MTHHYPKRLIEVDLPIKRISAHARREKSIRHGHISTLHIWWARRPLAACRAVICAALWPDPADEHCPPEFVALARGLMQASAKRFCATREGAAELMVDIDNDLRSSDVKKRKRAQEEAASRASIWRSYFDARDWPPYRVRDALLDFIAWGAGWEQSSLDHFLETSRALTQAAHEALGGAPGTRPLVVDPFAGGGSIPLEALRVGADAFASDLNPLPILLNKLAIDYVPRYGQRLTTQVRESLADLRVTLENTLKSYYFLQPGVENRLVYLWGRTIICEGPGCGWRFPLIRSLWIRQKPTRGVAFSFKQDARGKEVDVEILDQIESKAVGIGTSKQGAATCPVCGYTTPVEQVRRQLSARNGGAADAKLLAVGVSMPGVVGKFYRLPTDDELKCCERAKVEYMREKSLAERGRFLIPREELNHLRGFFIAI